MVNLRRHFAERRRRWSATKIRQEMLPPEKQGEAPVARLPVQLDRGVARVLEFLGSKSAQRVAGQMDRRGGAFEGRR